MSLTKQLWLAVIVIILLCLGGSFILTTYSAKGYFETQLYEKNVDNANNIALILSSQAFNPVFAELQINSQFDSGYYQRITLSAPQGGAIVEKSIAASGGSAPNWFVQLIAIEPSAGVANVTSGWRQIGELTVQSNTAFAYSQLWRSSQYLLFYFLVTALICGLIGHHLLQRMIQPLNSVVDQAKAIGERRFISIAVPRTLEFRALVESMNSLSARVKAMLLAEAERLQGQLSESSRDPATLLLRREAFIAQAKANVSRDDHTASGGVVVFYLDGLRELNTLYGRGPLDVLINEIGQRITQFTGQHSGAFAGRLDGSKFIVLIPGTDQQATLAEQLLQDLLEAIANNNIATDIVRCASCNYLPKEDFIAVLDKLDKALEHFDANLGELPVVHLQHKSQNLPNTLEAWQAAFQQAFTDNAFQLNLFPVINRDNQLLHFEAPIRLQYHPTQLLNAGEFLGWAQRVGIMPDLDTRALTLACDWLANQRSDIGINISPQLLSNAKARDTFLKVLAAHPQLAPRIWLEFPEQGVYHYLEEFKQFTRALKPLGCHIGIEHAGHAAEKLGLLHDVGLDYIKIDSAFIHDVHRENSTQVFLQGLVTIAHSIGLIIIAEGVTADAELSCLWNLGFDGMTGPAIGLND